MNIIQALQGKENLLNEDGVEESVVAAAERELNLKFAADFQIFSQMTMRCMIFIPISPYVKALHKPCQNAFLCPSHCTFDN